MTIGERLRQLREGKKLSQGDIEERTGLRRCYTSRVENGHTAPSIATLEKFAWVLEVPIYKIFYEGRKPPRTLKLAVRPNTDWVSSGKERAELRRFAKLLSHLDERQRRILLEMARHMERKKHKRNQNNSGGTAQMP